MQHISTITPSVLKSLLKPEQFYPIMLNGSFGRHTGNGWHAWEGLCPFHADRRKGSFYLNKDTGAFKCFSCGANGGDIIAFQQSFKQVTFKEAFKQLKEVAQCEK